MWKYPYLYANNGIADIVRGSFYKKKIIENLLKVDFLINLKQNNFFSTNYNNVKEKMFSLEDNNHENQILDD